MDESHENTVDAVDAGTQTQHDVLPQKESNIAHLDHTELSRFDRIKRYLSSRRKRLYGKVGPYLTLP